MKIRQATLADITQIMEMKKRGDGEKYLKRVKLSNAGQAAYLVIENDGEILANVFLKYYGTERDPNFPNTEDLFVREDLRDKGIGTKLMVECEKLSLKKGFKKIGLSVNPKLNPRAKKLYERLGYKVITGRAMRLSGTYDGVEDWCIDMVKNLV